MYKLIEFSLNQQNYFGKGKFSIYDLLTYFNYDNSLLVLEYNNFICEKKDWNTIFIQNGDKLELVTIVGGG